jgi:hypothetical protein
MENGVRRKKMTGFNLGDSPLSSSTEEGLNILKHEAAMDAKEKVFGKEVNESLSGGERWGNGAAARSERALKGAPRGESQRIH